MFVLELPHEKVFPNLILLFLGEGTVHKVLFLLISSNAFDENLCGVGLTQCDRIPMQYFKIIKISKELC